MYTLVCCLLAVRYGRFCGIIRKETIPVKVQKCDTVVLKCSSLEGVSTWLGPDVNNAELRNLVYFENTDKNPKLMNQTKFSLQENEGGNNLIIVNFLEENAGVYICRYRKDGTFDEMRFNVSLIEMLSSTTFNCDEDIHIVPDNATGYATHTTILLEGHFKNKTGGLNLIEMGDLSVSHDIRTLIWALSAFFIFIMTTTCTVFVASRVRRYSHVIHIVGPNVHLPSIPIYYSAPASKNSRHVYDQSIPQYLEVIESEGQDYLSDSNEDESTDEINIAVLDQSSHDYEEIQ